MGDSLRTEHALLPSENEDLLPGHLDATSRPKRRLATTVIGAVGLATALLLVLGLLASYGRVASTRARFMAAPQAIMEKAVVVDGCFTAGYYFSPPNMADQARTSELDHTRCQARCATVPGCEHFSYWPDGGCHLQSGTATAYEAPPKYADVISGPKSCTLRIDSTPAPDAQGLAVTACSAYPACVAAHLTQGDCCPNSDNVTLGCCMPSAPIVTTPIPSPGTECAVAQGCVALNITEGACCPTAAGIQLSCCGESPAAALKDLSLGASAPLNPYQAPDYSASEARSIILGASSHGEALDQLKASGFSQMTDDPVFEQCLNHLCQGCIKNPGGAVCSNCKYKCPYRTWQCCHRTFCPEMKIIGDAVKEPCLSRCGPRPTPNC